MDDDDFEDEAGDWEEEDDDGATVPCPYCRRPVYEDAERCPQCGNYLSEEEAPSKRRGWFLLALLLALACVTLWILTGI